ncbi:MAG: DUF1194 domain-containing protein [Planctomycetota bacterium]
MNTNVRLGSLAVAGLLCAVGAVFLLPSTSTVQEATALNADRVPLELVLLVDTSGSVDANEYNLQKQGYVDAFRDPVVQQRIVDVGGIAVTYIEWSNADHQNTRVDWTKLVTAEDCDEFSNDISLIGRTTQGYTMVAPALQYAAMEIANNNYDSLKWVIDVSGDGVGQNWDFHVNGNKKNDSDDADFYGTPWNSVLAAMPAGDSQINGICITTDQEVIDFYTDVLPQGDGAFMMQVDDFDEFGAAIREKLLREITAMPSVYD